MTQKFDVVLIVINYKKPELVQKLIASMNGMAVSERVLTLVVDNETTRHSQDVLEELEGSNVRVLFEEKNLGYFGGAQLALTWVKESGLAPEWVIISNSDIEFSQKSFWERLLSLPVTEDLGVIAPRIASGISASDQNPFQGKRPTATRMHFYKWCFRWYVTGAAYYMLGLLKDSLKGKSQAKTSQAAAKREEIYAPHGAFIVFHRNYFERGGDFVHGAFLYNEEFTVAETCREKGLKVVYEPSLAVEHAEHATLGVLPSRAAIKFHGEASRYTAERYFSR